ncbi:MAG: zf-HC2 domain-containing protein [Ilumatobacteraceae bacterium]|nr:zf-HC2 domain-containing protein [Ilumatobacteraceae bacterium]
MIRSTMRRLTFGRWPDLRPGEPMTCPEVGRLLQRFLDDELSDDVDAAMLSQHLELCRRCGLEAETYRRIKAALASRRAEVPEESIERLRAFGRQLTDGR